MKVIASWLNGTVRVEERDTGFAVVLKPTGGLPTRVGPLHSRRFHAMRAAEELATGVPEDDPTVGQ